MTLLRRRSVSNRSRSFERRSALLLPLKEAGVQLDLLLKLRPPVLESLQRHSLTSEARQEVEGIADDSLGHDLRRRPASRGRIESDQRSRLLCRRLLIGFECDELLLYLYCRLDGESHYDISRSLRCGSGSRQRRVVCHSIHIAGSAGSSIGRQRRFDARYLEDC